MNSSAIISECGLYRYSLRRTWDVDLPTMTYVMLNPSKADASEDDPTIRKCRGFAERLGFGGFFVVNLFAYRATKPKDLYAFGLVKAIGPENNRAILEAARSSRSVVAAWGGNKTEGRSTTVKRLLASNGIQLFALAFTDKGEPRHPLMLGYEGVSLKPYA